MKTARLVLASVVALLMIGILSPEAGAFTMTFGATGGDSSSEFTPFVEDGITMTPVVTTPPSGAGPPHWDRLRSQSGGTSSDADNNAEIHRGNAGEKVQFTFTSGAFDLLSLDLEQFDFDGALSLTVTFKASSGATHTASSVGTIDFTALSGWSNITDFTMELPLNNVTCVAGQTDCSGVRFDNIVLGPPTIEETPGGVPEPTTLGLLTLGLIGLAARGYRKAA